MISLGLLYSCSPVAASTTYRSEKPVICGTVDEIIELVKEQGEEIVIDYELVKINAHKFNSFYTVSSLGELERS